MAWKRTSARWEVDFPCWYLWSDRRHDGVIIDISAGGAFIDSASPASAGASLELRFRPTSKDPEFILDGKVTHSGWYDMDGERVQGFGLRFSALSMNSIQRLEDLLQNQVAPNSRFAKPKVEVEPDPDHLNLERRQYLQRVLSFFEGSGCGYLVLSDDGRILAANATACDLLEMTLNRLHQSPGRPFFAISDHWEDLLQMEPGVPVRAVNTCILGAEGSERECEVRAWPWFAADGHLMGYHMSLRDITSERRSGELNKRLQRRTAILLGMSVLGGRFSDTLTTILGHAIGRPDASGAKPDARSRVDEIVAVADKALDSFGLLMAAISAAPSQRVLEVEPAVRKWSEAARRRFPQLAFDILGGSGRTSLTQTHLNLILSTLCEPLASKPVESTIRITVEPVELDEPMLISLEKVPAGSYVLLQCRLGSQGHSRAEIEQLLESLWTERTGRDLRYFALWAILHRCGGALDVSDEDDGVRVLLYLPTGSAAA